MKHGFIITKHVACARSQVIANYLDLQHLSPVHTTLIGCRVLSESERAACFVLTSRILGLRFSNVHYYEFRPPHQIFQSVKGPLGPMSVLATVEEVGTTDQPRCSVRVETELDLPGWTWPLRGLIERVLRRSNATVFHDDHVLLLRRQALFGADVSDYLRDEQPLLFKDAFRACYGSSD